MNGSATTVVAAIIRRGKRLLLTRRSNGVHLGGQWEFPGGKVEPNESLESALSREIQEELGVEIEIGQLVMECTHRYPERTVHLHFFESRIKAGEPDKRSAAALGWFLPGELGRLDYPEGNRQLIELLQDRPIHR